MAQRKRQKDQSKLMRLFSSSSVDLERVEGNKFYVPHNFAYSISEKSATFSNKCHFWLKTSFYLLIIVIGLFLTVYGFVQPYDGDFEFWFGRISKRGVYLWVGVTMTIITTRIWGIYEYERRQLNKQYDHALVQGDHREYKKSDWRSLKFSTLIDIGWSLLVLFCLGLSYGSLLVAWVDTRQSDSYILTNFGEKWNEFEETIFDDIVLLFISKIYLFVYTMWQIFYIIDRLIRRMVFRTYLRKFHHSVEQLLKMENYLRVLLHKDDIFEPDLHTFLLSIPLCPVSIDDHPELDTIERGHLHQLCLKNFSQDIKKCQCDACKKDKNSELKKTLSAIEDRLINLESFCNVKAKDEVDEEDRKIDARASRGTSFQAYSPEMSPARGGVVAKMSKLQFGGIGRDESEMEENLIEQKIMHGKLPKGKSSGIDVVVRVNGDDNDNDKDADVKQRELEIMRVTSQESTGDYDSDGDAKDRKDGKDGRDEEEKHNGGDNFDGDNTAGDVKSDNNNINDSKDDEIENNLQAVMKEKHQHGHFNLFKHNSDDHQEKERKKKKTKNRGHHDQIEKRPTLQSEEIEQHNTVRMGGHTGAKNKQQRANHMWADSISDGDKQIYYQHITLWTQRHESVTSMKTNLSSIKKASKMLSLIMIHKMKVKWFKMHENSEKNLGKTKKSSRFALPSFNKNKKDKKTATGGTLTAVPETSAVDQAAIDFGKQCYFSKDQFVDIFTDKDSKHEQVNQRTAKKAFAKFNIFARDDKLYFEEIETQLNHFLLLAAKKRSQLESFKNILNTVHHVGTGFGAFVVLFLGLILFEPTFVDALSVFVSVLAVSLIFGRNILSRVMNGIVFIFFVKPFSIGDAILINGKRYNVKKITLFRTTMTDSFGSLYQWTNDELLGKMGGLVNLSATTSTEYKHDIYFYIAANDLYKLEQKHIVVMRVPKDDHEASSSSGKGNWKLSASVKPQVKPQLHPRPSESEYSVSGDRVNNDNGYVDNGGYKNLGEDERKAEATFLELFQNKVGYEMESECDSSSIQMVIGDFDGAHSTIKIRLWIQSYSSFIDGKARFDAQNKLYFLIARSLKECNIEFSRYNNCE